MHATQNHDRLAFENSDTVIYLQQCACRDVVFCGIQLSSYSSLEHSGNEYCSMIGQLGLWIGLLNLLEVHLEVLSAHLEVKSCLDCYKMYNQNEVSCTFLVFSMFAVSRFF